MKINFDCPVYSQYDSNVKKSYRSSACGPTAVASILHFYKDDALSINQLYEALHCTKIGLPAAFIHWFLPRAVQGNYSVRTLRLFEAIHWIQQKQPVAVKFDRYFTWKLNRPAYFKYHWTVMTGFYWKRDGLYLIVEDLGTPNRDSRTHEVPYAPNAHALTFIGIHPT